MRTHLIAAFAVLMATAGCSSISQQAKVSPVASVSPPAERGPYLIQEGDTLDIKFRNTPELDDTVVVRPDGRISLIYLGDVQAADLTVDGLKQALMVDYTSNPKSEAKLVNPTIYVSLKASTATRVFIGGEVNQPGEYSFPGRGTLLQYLTKAGGIKPSGEGGQIVLVRRGPQFTPQMSVLDVDKVLNGEEMSGEIQLAPYDVVYVPPSSITKVDRFADQYVRQIIPVSFAFNYVLP
jgi:polysaccharide export outer membrane protein